MRPSGVILGVVEGELLGEGDGPGVGGAEGVPVGCVNGGGDSCTHYGKGVSYLQSFPSRTKKGPI